MVKYVDKIVRARVALLLKQPFWGTLATRLQLVDATDDESGWCKTAATDGRSLFYNREFIDKLSKDEPGMTVLPPVCVTFEDGPADADLLIGDEIHILGEI